MKKFKFLALALAFCLVASFIPAPVAAAADGDLLCPMFIDLTNPSSADIYLYNANNGTNNLDQAPVFDTNGFSFNTESKTYVAVTWYGSDGFNARLSAGLPSITFTVKAPAGNYAVLAEGLNQQVQVTVGETTATVTGTGGRDTVLESVVLDDSGSVDITFRNNTGNPYNLDINKILFIPAGEVNARFYGGDLPTNSNFTFYGIKKILNGDTKYESSKAYMLSYEKHGCEYNMDITDNTGANHQYKAANLQYRVAKNSSNVELAVNVWVPKSGKYTTTFLTNGGNSQCVPLDIYVQDTKVGTVDATSGESTYNFDTQIDLVQGVNVVKIIASNTGSSDSYNYPAGFTLTPVEEEDPETPKAEIPASDIFGDTYAYVKDGDLYFIGGLKTIANYTEVGFEVKVDGTKVDDIKTSQVYTSFTVNEQTVNAANWDSIYIFITTLEDVGDAESVTILPYIANGTTKTYHEGLEALTLDLTKLS